MEYRELLAHLARFHQIDSEGMPTFKARIHILRKVGVPPVEKVGKGARATFSADDLAELHLALTMSEFGLSPLRIAQIMMPIRITTPWWPFTKHTDKWLIIALRASNAKLSDMDSSDVIQGITIVGKENLEKDLKVYSGGVPTWNAVLSLSKIAENLRSVR